MNDKLASFFRKADGIQCRIEQLWDAGADSLFVCTADDNLDVLVRAKQFKHVNDGFCVQAVAGRTLFAVEYDDAA